MLPVLLVLTALSAAISIVSGAVSMYEAVKNHRGQQGQPQRLAFGLFISTLVFTIIFLLASVLSGMGKSEGNPIQVSNSPQPTRGTTPTQTQQPPTATPTPKPIPVPAWHGCQYGINYPGRWTDWGPPSGWTILNGMLLSDSAAQYFLPAPSSCQPTKPDYAVEVKEKVVNGNSGFGVVVRANAPNDGYAAWEWPDICAINISFTSNWTDVNGTRASICDNAYHTYRTEVKGNTLKLFVDRAQYVSGNDNTYLNPGTIFIYADHVQLQIDSFTVTPL